MDTEADGNFKDPGVESLQAVLFPINSSRKSATSPGGFFTNIIFKNALETNEPKDEEEIVKKDSKELFTVVKDPASAIQPARWPTECQVLDEKIEHISYAPSTPEPYYKSTGKEVQPKPIGEECGTVVYQYYPISAANYFSRSSVGGSRFLLPTCPASEEDTLKFESRFESGNLAKVIRITATYYELYLRTDLYTNKHTQWFYFRVTKTKKNLNYRFSIANMAKNTSLYTEGLKPLMYSVKDARLHSIGWRRCGDNITYFCNENIGPDDPEDMMTYTLTYTLEFPHDDDEVYFAYSYPYTYSNLQDYLMDTCKHPVKSTFTTLRLLCRTMAGNNVYYITITSPQEIPDKKKRAIVISARVHPGETPASWMMKGILDYLTSDCGPAKELREKFIFKIVPMLNPDGVIVGNNRCSLTGRDLNRQYRSVIRESYPSVWYTKLMIRRMIEECGVAMYCDLHAHSRKHNIFIYGCENRKNPDRRLIEQVYPLMLHKNTADKFSFEDCKFKIQKNKEGTGRVVMWMMGICNSYTMEASFCGSVMNGPRFETHFSTQDYEMMGRSFCQTLLDYYDEDPRKERLRVKIIERLHKEGSNAVEPTNISLSDYSSDAGDSSDSTSDEVGHEDYCTSLLVPPPSPAYVKRAPKPKASKSKTKSAGKSTNPTRKVFHCTTAIFADTFPRQKAKYVSDSDSDSSYNYQKKHRNNPRRRKSKKQNKEPFRIICYAKHSDSEIQISKSPSEFEETEFISMAKFRSHSWHRTKPKSSKHRSGTENLTMQNTTQQLHEVQAKLRTLKSKLWFGAGEGNTLPSSVIPLSWGTSKFCETKTNRKPKRATSAKAQAKGPHSKYNKQEENNAKNKKKHKEKQDKEKTEKSAKTNKQNGKSEKDARPKRSKIQINIHVKDDIKHRDEDNDGCETNNTKAHSKKKKKKASVDKKTKAVCKQTSKD